MFPNANKILKKYETVVDSVGFSESMLFNNPAIATGATEVVQELVLGSLSHLAIVEYCWWEVTQFILEGFCCKVLVDHDPLSDKFSGEYPSLFLSIGSYLDSWLRRHLFGTLLTTPFEHSIDHNTVHTAQDLVPYFNCFMAILESGAT